MVGTAPRAFNIWFSMQRYAAHRGTSNADRETSLFIPDSEHHNPPAPFLISRQGSRHGYIGSMVDENSGLIGRSSKRETSHPQQNANCSDDCTGRMAIEQSLKEEGAMAITL